MQVTSTCSDGTIKLHVCVLDSKQEVEALNATDVFISQLVVNPGIFNDTVDIFVELLKSCNLSHSAISLISEKIFEMVSYSSRERMCICKMMWQNQSLMSEKKGFKPLKN